MTQDELFLALALAQEINPEPDYWYTIDQILYLTTYECIEVNNALKLYFIPAKWSTITINNSVNFIIHCIFDIEENPDT